MILFKAERETDIDIDIHQRFSVIHFGAVKGLLFWSLSLSNSDLLFQMTTV